MNPIVPPMLVPGDTIVIVATARWVDAGVLAVAVKTIESWGLKVKTGTHVTTRQFQLAGSDEERATELQSALDDPSVKAIVIARGGYGTVRVVDRLNWDGFMQHPKWICGYSDITVLHSIVNGLGCATMHSVNAMDFSTHDPEAISSLESLLFGKTQYMEWQPADYSATNFATGPLPLLGGNLSVLFSLLGSASFRPSFDHILFVEDVSEYLYHIDRMLMGLKRSGTFRHTKALLCGGFTEMKDNTKAFQFEMDNPWGMGALEMMGQLAGELNVPIVTGFPAGHFERNMAFPLGRTVSMTNQENKAMLSW